MMDGGFNATSAARPVFQRPGTSASCAPLWIRTVMGITAPHSRIPHPAYRVNSTQLNAQPHDFGALHAKYNLSAALLSG